MNKVRHRHLHSHLKMLILASAVFMASCSDRNGPLTGLYVSGDFHQHTTYSGGKYSIGHVFELSNKYGLDCWANSDHGGTREFWGLASGSDIGAWVSWKDAGINIKGSPQDPENEGFMWRWQSIKDYSFRDILLWRRIFTDKLILQAFEWNVPGYQHANVSVIANQFDSLKKNCDPLAQFEYMFDDDDNDTTGGLEIGWKKNRMTGREKALEAIRWLQSNYPFQSYVIPSHPDESGEVYISDFRDMNNAGPDVCFGFDGMPGHQKNTTRGGYDSENYPWTCVIDGKTGNTFGGAGIFASKVGGVWDALLSEGRRWWISASSDFHSDNDFAPGEYQKTYILVTRKNDPQALIDGLRSGNRFIVTGDLITGLRFSAGNATMGQTFKTNKKVVKITIRILDPDTSNYNTFSDYTNPELDHIDLIAGRVTGLIDPSDPGYFKDTVSTTRIIARFDARGGIKDPNGIESLRWTDSGDGWKTMTFNAEINGKMYFRLRGTNLALNTPGELDGAGNPLPDFTGENTPAKAFADLWFYSNPVFVEPVNN